MKLGVWTLLGCVAWSLSAGALAADRDYLSWAGISDAWKITKGNGVKIALLNTGVNYQLPEFRGRIEKDEVGNYGFDAVTGSHDPMDLFEYGLGTQVASLTLGNEMGIAPEATFVPVRIFDENGSSDLQIIARGVEYAVNRGVEILEIGGGPLNLEKGGKALCDALQKADGAGILIVLPAGNNGSALREYPTGCPLTNVVNVAAVNDQGELSSYSNFGFPAVHLAAPAENIWRISRDGSVQKDGKGTSFSTGFAAGVAALVWSAHPAYTAAEVKTALIRGSVARDSLRGKVLANGFLNAALAIGADISRAE